MKKILYIIRIVFGFGLLGMGMYQEHVGNTAEATNIYLWLIASIMLTNMVYLDKNGT
jgi:hypothetical protein